MRKLQATLGVYPLAYLPYALMNLLNPIMSILFGFTGITMERTATEQGRASEEAVGPA